MVSVTIRSIGSLLDAMRMRGVRNTVRQYMTRDTSHIGVARQIGWYYRVFLGNQSIRAYLMLKGNRAIGYGIVRMMDNRWWVTGALLPESRGLGYGRALFSFLTWEASRLGGGWAWLDVRFDNEPAKALYASLGYKALEMRDGIMTMGRIDR